MSQPVEQQTAGACPRDGGTEGVDVNSDPALEASEAMAAVQVGLFASAVRCLLAYVVAPAAGAFGIFLGPLGLVLQLLGAVTSSAGARRLWRLGHRARIPYAAVAIAVCALSAISFVQLASEAMR